jgi:hypothetical protein
MVENKKKKPMQLNIMILSPFCVESSHFGVKSILGWIPSYFFGVKSILGWVPFGVESILGWVPF